MKRRTLDVIRVFRSPGDPRRGRLVAGAVALPCALGRSGTTRTKREGDGATPVGRVRALGLHVRLDRTPRPQSGLPVVPIRPDAGWCDDPRGRPYNRPVRLPCALGHERMWRDDDLYDLVVDLGWNRGPVRRGHGSAIFLHVSRPDFAPTEGCVAVARAAIARLCQAIGPRTIIDLVDGCGRHRPVSRGARSWD